MVKRLGYLCLFSLFFFWTDDLLWASGIANICVQHVNDDVEFHSRWGGSAVSSFLPKTFLCPGDNNQSTVLNNPKMQYQSASDQTWVSARITQIKLGIFERTTNVSFMIPRAAMTYWNHLANHAAYHEGSFDRMGGAVFLDKLYVQYTAAECGLPTSIFNGVTIKDPTSPFRNGLRADRWYRAYSHLRYENGILTIKASLEDLATKRIIAETSYQPSCVSSNFLKDENRWLVGVASLTPIGVKPRLETHVADFEAIAY